MAKRKIRKQVRSQPAATDTRTGEELIKVMQQGRKLGLKLKPARVPAILRPPIDFSDDEP
jgi:hypothetical protein